MVETIKQIHNITNNKCSVEFNSDFKGYKPSKKFLKQVRKFFHIMLNV